MELDPFYQEMSGYKTKTPLSLRQESRDHIKARRQIDRSDSDGTSRVFPTYATCSKNATKIKLGTIELRRTDQPTDQNQGGNNSVTKEESPYQTPPGNLNG